MLGALSKNQRQMLYERLADSGVVRAERSRILGVVPVHRWPAQDASHEAEVRRLVTQVLVHQVAADTRIAALIALLRALECEDKIVDPGQHGLSKRELRARAEKIAEGNWASQVIRKAIEETMAAVLTATTAATIATTASAG